MSFRYPEFRANVLDALLNYDIAGNGDVLAATSTLCIQVTSAARLDFLTRLASILTSRYEAVHLVYIVEVSVALFKDGQFGDADGFLKAICAGLSSKTAEVEDGSHCVTDSEWRLVNFCILLGQLCQRKSPPKSLLTDLCNEYLKNDDFLRQAVEAAVLPVYWPAPKARGSAHAGGPPPELMNMLSGLLGARR